MIKELINYLRKNKEQYTKIHYKKTNYEPGWVSSVGTWWPSSYDLEKVPYVDMDALLDAMDKFAQTFKEN